MKSQRQMILEYLMRGEVITDKIARDKYGCTRLADVIWKIRKNHEVITKMIPFKHPSGARSRFAVYHLPKYKTGA